VPFREVEPQEDHLSLVAAQWTPNLIREPNVHSTIVSYIIKPFYKPNVSHKKMNKIHNRKRATLYFVSMVQKYTTN